MLRSLPIVERMFNKAILRRVAQAGVVSRGDADARQTAAATHPADARPARAVGAVERCGYTRVRLGRGDRAGDDRGALPLALGRLSAGLRERGVTAGFLAPHPGGGGRAGEFLDRLWILPRARGLFRARAPVHDRAFGRGP